jgi:LysM repeat protein
MKLVPVLALLSLFAHPILGIQKTVFLPAYADGHHFKHIATIPGDHCHGLAKRFNVLLQEFTQFNPHLLCPTNSALPKAKTIPVFFDDLYKPYQVSENMGTWKSVSGVIGVPIGTLKKLNFNIPLPLKKGDIIVIPGAAEHVKKASKEETYAFQPRQVTAVAPKMGGPNKPVPNVYAPDAKQDVVVFTAMPGETCRVLAQRAGLTMSTFEKLNPHLSCSSKTTIPRGPVVVFRTSKYKPHTVLVGESCESIAKQYKTTVGSLIKAIPELNINCNGKLYNFKHVAVPNNDEAEDQSESVFHTASSGAASNYVTASSSRPSDYATAPVESEESLEETFHDADSDDTSVWATDSVDNFSDIMPFPSADTSVTSFDSASTLDVSPLTPFDSEISDTSSVIGSDADYQDSLDSLEWDHFTRVTPFDSLEYRSISDEDDELPPRHSDAIIEDDNLADYEEGSLPSVKEIESLDNEHDLDPESAEYGSAKEKRISKNTLKTDDMGEDVSSYKENYGAPLASLDEFEDDSNDDQESSVMSESYSDEDDHKDLDNLNDDIFKVAYLIRTHGCHTQSYDEEGTHYYFDAASEPCKYKNV